MKRQFLRLFVRIVNMNSSQLLCLVLPCLEIPDFHQDRNRTLQGGDFKDLEQPVKYNGLSRSKSALPYKIYCNSLDMSTLNSYTPYACYDKIFCKFRDSFKTQPPADRQLCPVPAGFCCSKHSYNCPELDGTGGQLAVGFEVAP